MSVKSADSARASVNSGAAADAKHRATAAALRDGRKAWKRHCRLRAGFRSANNQAFVEKFDSRLSATYGKARSRACCSRYAVVRRPERRREG